MHVRVAYSSAQVAKLLAVGRATFHRWIKGEKLSGRLRPPALRKVAGVSVRIWTASDLKRARQYKRRFYRKRTGKKRGKPKRER
jgi:hypothetical protein